jgi:hypothetical protein
MKATPSNQTPQPIFGPPREPKNIEERPNKSESKKNLLFRGTPIEQDEQELSASFMQNETPQNRHNLTLINHLSSKITSLQ